MPLDEDIIKNPVITLDAQEFDKLSGAKAGAIGKGDFDFRVIHDEMAGMVQIELIHLKLETDNTADKELAKMTDQEERALPASADDEENDDI